MKEWIIRGRFTLDTHAIVEADTAEEAKIKFEGGEFEMDHSTISVVSWNRCGEPENTD